MIKAGVVTAVGGGMIAESVAVRHERREEQLAIAREAADRKNWDDFKGRMADMPASAG